MGLLIILSIWTGLALLGWIFENAKKIRENRASVLARKEYELKQQAEKLAAEKSALARYTTDARAAIDGLAKEKALGFPWLATAYSEYFYVLDRILAKELEEKKHPARRSADVIRTIGREKAALRRENKILRDLHRYYEHLFPWLIDFKGEELDDLIRQVHDRTVADEGDTEIDPAAVYLTTAERESEKLTRSEKFQRALDRYWTRHKTPWEVGRDYERYIGYVHEREGYKVEYHGIAHGYEDLGRDLICTKGDDVRVIQCKCWRSDKLIHEKHICQLIGTTIMYEKTRVIDPTLVGKPRISSWLFTSATVSETATKFASMLSVQIGQNVPLGRYPAIKCNVSLRDGTKIYHLPFDQQYDRTLIEFEDERYVATVAEAEALGFRRAFRWRGNNPQFAGATS
jgi:restriction endonuclease